MDVVANHNLFAALSASFPKDLSASFPKDLSACAVETDSGLRYSWGDLDLASARLANFLASLGLPEGSRIAVQVDKSVEALTLYLATLRAGLVYLPLNTAYRSAEMAYFIEDAQPSVVVCPERNYTPIKSLLPSSNVFTLNDDRTGSLLSLADSFPTSHTTAQRAANDLAAIIYTSGTTGRSKGAMLSHGNLLSNARVLQTYWDWRPTDVLIHALPIFHVHGLFVAIHGALLNSQRA